MLGSFVSGSITVPSSWYSNRHESWTVDHNGVMSRPPAAREAVLDAFERIIITEGERAATLDATARAAGVSKGGLLYHFGSSMR